jgi:hypothetical protein
LPLAGERKPGLVPNAPASAEGGGQFSPDGKWIAFTSRESGTDEVYVIPFDSSMKNSHASDGGSKWQISTRGGRCPRWTGDGKEIYWLLPRGEITAAQIEYKDSGVQVRTPEPVLQAAIEMVIFEPYDVTRDGKKFVVNTLRVSGPYLQPLDQKDCTSNPRGVGVRLLGLCPNL